MEVYITNVQFMNWWTTRSCASKCIEREHTVNSVKISYGLYNNNNVLEGKLTIPFNIYNEMNYEELTSYIIKSLDLGKVSEQESVKEQRHVTKNYLTADVIQQGSLKSGFVRYNCLCCG